MFAHPIDRAAIDFVQVLIRPEYGVRVLCRRRDLSAMPADYYSTCSVMERGYCYSFWLCEGCPQLLIRVEGLGVFEAAYEDEWPLVLAIGLQQYPLAA
ncbi:MAG: hypothetical protein ACRYFX_08620 [Janthinobacterium lividum]